MGESTLDGDHTELGPTNSVTSLSSSSWPASDLEHWPFDLGCWTSDHEMVQRLLCTAFIPSLYFQYYVIVSRTVICINESKQLPWDLWAVCVICIDVGRPWQHCCLSTVCLHAYTVSVSMVVCWH